MSSMGESSKERNSEGRKPFRKRARQLSTSSSETTSSSESESLSSQTDSSPDRSQKTRVSESKAIVAQEVSQGVATPVLDCNTSEVFEFDDELFSRETPASRKTKPEKREAKREYSKRIASIPKPAPSSTFEEEQRADETLDALRRKCDALEQENKELKALLQKIEALASGNREVASDQQKARYDGGASGSKDLNVGDKALVLLPTEG